MPASPPTPATVIAEAKQWLGVPWRHQGRTRAGLDCAGLVVVVGRALELVTYDFVGYPRRASGFAFVEHFQMNMDAVRITDAAPGDVLLFADHAYPCHCGIITRWGSDPHFIHAHVTRRKVVEEPYIGEWPAKVKFAFRFRGIGGHEIEARNLPETFISGGVA